MKGGCFSAHCIPIYFHHSRWHLEEQKLMLTGLSTCVHSCGLAVFPALSSSGTGSGWVPPVVHCLENYKCFLTEWKSKNEKRQNNYSCQWGQQSGQQGRSLNPRDATQSGGSRKRARLHGTLEWGPGKIDLSCLECSSIMLALDLGLSVQGRM